MCMQQSFCYRLLIASAQSCIIEHIFMIQEGHDSKRREIFFACRIFSLPLGQSCFNPFHSIGNKSQYYCFIIESLNIFREGQVAVTHVPADCAGRRLVAILAMPSWHAVIVQWLLVIPSHVHPCTSPLRFATLQPASLTGLAQYDSQNPPSGQSFEQIIQRNRFHFEQFVIPALFSHEKKNKTNCVQIETIMVKYCQMRVKVTFAQV